MAQSQSHSQPHAAIRTGRKAELKSAVADRTLIVRRRFDAPPARVFRAFTDPADMAAWLGPQGFTCPHCQLDVRAGGAWRACLRSAEGQDNWVSGVYREIRPPGKLVFTWAWDQADGSRGNETVVTLEFRADGAGTELVLRQELFATTEFRDNHRKGWTSSFDCLAEHLAGQRAGGAAD